jgi:hypothetical protein
MTNCCNGARAWNQQTSRNLQRPAIARFYKGSGRPDKAAEWSQKLASNLGVDSGKR